MGCENISIAYGLLIELSEGFGLTGINVGQGILENYMQSVAHWSAVQWDLTLNPYEEDANWSIDKG